MLELTDSLVGGCSVAAELLHEKGSLFVLLTVLTTHVTQTAVNKLLPSGYSLAVFERLFIQLVAGWLDVPNNILDSLNNNGPTLDECFMR